MVFSGGSKRSGRVNPGQALASAALVLAVAAAFVGCGGATRASSESNSGSAGDLPVPASGGDAGAFEGAVGGAPATGGSRPTEDFAGSGGLGGDDSAVDGGAGGESPCTEGAACSCDRNSGTLKCAAADGSSDPHCVCPAKNSCEAPLGTCFEPCGGDAAGVWVLEDTCFKNAALPDECQGGSLDGTALKLDLRLRILENEKTVSRGEESWKIRARVPLACLQIASVNRCTDAQTYVDPLLYTVSRPLDCRASACGFCDCQGDVEADAGNGYFGFGRAWTPGSESLFLSDTETPYCASGDTLWVGGSDAKNRPKVSYKFRRRSCIGTPTACAARSAEQCGIGGDCTPGRCLPEITGAPGCSDAQLEDQCVELAGCRWDPEGCWGTRTESCDFFNCDETPGCSWGPPKARCGGVPTPCYEKEVTNCKADGCSVRTCQRMDEDVQDLEQCQKLDAGACSKATGCVLSGATCTGTTSCAAQTDPEACAALDCAPSPTPVCGGFRIAKCEDLSVDACHSEPGCRLEW